MSSPLTPTPLSYASDTELGHKLNAKFAELRDGTHTLAATFDMGNGYTFTIWERVAAPHSCGSGDLPPRLRRRKCPIPRNVLAGRRELACRARVITPHPPIF